MAESPDHVYEAPCSSAARLLLTLLWRHSDAKGKPAHPSVPTLARLTRQAERSVRRQLVELESKQLIRRAGVTSRGVVRWALPLTGGSPLTAVSPLTDESARPLIGQSPPPDWPSPLPLTGGSPKPIEPKGEPSSSSFASSGELMEIDIVRREVEAKTGKKIGGLTHRVDKLDGLGPAVAEHGLPKVLEVVRHRCEGVASGKVAPQLWRRLFSGDGFYAALEAFEGTRTVDDQRVAERVEKRERERNTIPGDDLSKLAANAIKRFEV